MTKPRFGLNSGATLTGVFMKQSRGGKPYVMAEISLGERTLKWFGFLPDKAWSKSEGGWVTSGPEMDEELARFESTIYDLFEAAKVPKKHLKRSEDQSLEDYLNEVVPMCKKNFVDIWLEYEPKIRDGQARTWLTLPKNNRFGSFIAEATPGKWKKQETSDEEVFLVYADEDTGEQHRFTRSNWYCGTNYAKVQGEVTNGRKSAPQGKTKTTAATPKATAPKAASVDMDLDEEDDLPF